MGYLEGQYGFRRQERVCSFRLGHNLGRTEGTSAGYVRRRKGHGGTTTAALHLQSVCGQWAQLSGSQIEVGLI